MKRYLPFAIFVGIIALLAFTYCSGRNAGRDDDRIKNIQANVELHKKAAELYKSEAAKEKKRGDSLERKVNYADSIVQVKHASLVKASLSYNRLRDSVLKAHGETPISILSVIAAADSALEASSAVIRAHEAKDVVQDSVISSLKRQVLLSDRALSERESQIGFLNKQIEIQARELRRAKVNGWLKTAGAGVGGFLLGKATKP
jgi:hypothetical protein